MNSPIVDKNKYYTNPTENSSQLEVQSKISKAKAYNPKEREKNIQKEKYKEKLDKNTYEAEKCII